MPARKVPQHRGSTVGQFPSMKMKRMVVFESSLERDFIYLLDYNPSVTWFEEQPLRIEYVHEEKQLHYTPDFHLIEQGKQVLVECKPERFINTAENHRKFTIAETWCQERGWQFRIVTEQQIRTGYRLQNVKLLTRYARQRADPVVRSQILAFLFPSQPGATIREIARCVFPGFSDLVTSHILHMAYQHEIDLKLDTAPISTETTISLRFEPQTEVRDD